MQFTYDGVFHRVARITGPRHNYLALRLTDGPSEPPPVEALGKSAQSSLNGDSVLLHALEGMEAANRRFGSRFRVVALQYVIDDTPPESIYRELAYRIVERLARGEPFTPVVSRL